MQEERFDHVVPHREAADRRRTAVDEDVRPRRGAPVALRVRRVEGVGIVHLHREMEPTVRIEPGELPYTPSGTCRSPFTQLRSRRAARAADEVAPRTGRHAPFDVDPRLELPLVLQCDERHALRRPRRADRFDLRPHGGFDGRLQMRARTSSTLRPPGDFHPHRKPHGPREGVHAHPDGESWR